MNHGNQIKVLALDLDGTLTNSEKKVTQRTKMVLRKAAEGGVNIVLASGRPLLGITSLAHELELETIGGYILAYNGGQIIECSQNRELVSSVVPQQYYQELYEIVKQFPDIEMLTYQNQEILCEHPENEYAQKEAFCNGTQLTKTEYLLDAIKHPVHKFLIVGEPHRLSRCEEYVRRQFAGVLNVFHSTPYFLEVVPPGIHKAASLQYILDDVGVEKSQLMACGDGMNDIEMIEFAGIGVAMENAEEAVKEKADFITGSNNEDGVAAAVERFILTDFQ